MQPCSPSVLAASYAADLAFGDPPHLPHPVRLIGWVISVSQSVLRPPRSAAFDFIAGTALTLMLIVGSWKLCRVLMAGAVAEIILGWTTLATKSLISEATAVLRELENSNLHAARCKLSRIVGRDTADLSEADVARAAIETIGESLCDGIVAPIFFLAIGGVPMAMAYKALNTLDSMIGHPEAPYTYFGRFAARADDLANLLPARLTALLICLSGPDTSSALRTWWEDGRKHPSPNAGQSEAAIAGALRARLGGVNTYDGRASKKPLLGSQFRSPNREDIRRAIQIAQRVSLAAFACAFVWTLTRSRP